jgi:membrane protein YqaA with SNARE-associated domain
MENVRSEKVLIIAFLGSLCNMLGIMTTYTFGTLLVQDYYPATPSG